MESLVITDGVGTDLTISAQDIQNMVGDGNNSQLTILADSGDQLVVDTTGGYDVVSSPDGVDHTIYTDASHIQQLAQIHWIVS